MIKVFIFFFFLFNLSFAQDTDINDTPTPDDSPIIIPDIREFKVKYLTESLRPEELYKLATLYLSQKCYIQSAELYGQYLEIQEELPQQRIIAAHYNRALSLFSLNLHDSSLEEFQNAYFKNNELFDSLRMIGTIYFIKQNKEKSLEYWKQYLEQNQTESPERIAIQNAVALLSNPNFKFESEKPDQSSESKLWQFLNPDIIPNPDATYQKKRVI